MIRMMSVALGLSLFAGNAWAQNAAHGKELFTDTKCGVCHSIGSTGNKKGPLDGVALKLSAAEIREWITAAPEMAVKAKADRKPPMKSYPDLSTTDVDDLVAYLQTLKKK